MSDKTPNPTVHTVTDLPQADDAETMVVIKSPRLAKAKALISKHKSTILAGAGLVALVGVSAAAGRASAPTTTFGDVYLPGAYDDDAIAELEIPLDTPVPTDD